MCGRYAFDDIKEIYEARRIIEEISSRLGRETADSVKTGEVFPSDSAAVLAQNGEEFNADVMEWGYPLKDSKRLVINARSESAEYTRLFSSSLNFQKCLVPCTGYFEWKATGALKSKYKIKPEGENLFYLAGLYNSYSIGGKDRKRFVILTREADPQIKDIHDRMPVIVKSSDINRWFSNGYGEEKLRYLLHRTEKYTTEPATGK
jgi:putative SOS response-associated peptidase YedK